MKYANEIIKFGKIKPYFDKTYSFNTIDIETIENELFLFGNTSNGVHNTLFDNFYINFHEFLLDCIRNHKDVLTWTRYDNTHLLKLILSKATKKDIKGILENVGKISPIYEYEYNSFTITIVNIIHDSIIIKIEDLNGIKRNVVLYNLANLYDTDLLTTAKNYSLDYYSKLGIEYHIIDKKRFKSDRDYKKGVIESNRLDNIVLIDIANAMIENFKLITGKIPKSIFTNGSLARSYLLAELGTYKSKLLNFNGLFTGRFKEKLLDYSMRAYHGGKIESYILGYVPKAKIIDITSAYPYAMSLLPQLTNKIIHSTSKTLLQNYFYAWIKCDIHIKDRDLIHPVIVESPINKSNISPYGYFTATITKIEYDYLLTEGVKIDIIDFYAVEHKKNVYPYKDIIDTLFNKRMETKESNPSLSQMYKIILNSMYGITYELTDVYEKFNGKIEWQGYRGGDYLNPCIASYITAMTRTDISRVSYNIVLNGGKILLNMTDSILYIGNPTLDVSSQVKILGKYDMPKPLIDIYVLGAGRYEYQNEFTKKFTIKNRGFSVNVKDKSFYSNLHLSGKISLAHRTFVTSYKASTKKYGHEKMGYLIDDTYNIDPFNLGGKRIIENYNVDLNNDYTDTRPVYLEKGII